MTLDQLTASEIEQLIRAKPAIAVSLNNLGNLAIERGDAATAQVSYRECLALAREVGEQVALVYSLSGLAAVMAQRADLPRAARLAAAAETLRRRCGLTIILLLVQSYHELHTKTSPSEQCAGNPFQIRPEDLC